MISVLHIARNTCCGSVLQVLHRQTHVFKQSNVMRNVVGNNAVKSTSFLSTSQRASAEHSEHSHSGLWTAERFLSASLLGLLPVSLAFPNPALDYALALALTAHVHWGVEAIVVDYLRPTVVGVTIARIGVASIYALSVLTLGGLFYFNYTDVGLSQAIRMLWKL